MTPTPETVQLAEAIFMVVGFVLLGLIVGVAL